MTSPDVNASATYVTTAAAIVYLQQWLKTWPAYARLVQAVPVADKWLHRTVAALAALAAAVGIHVTFAGTFDAGWTFHGSIPAGWDLLHGVTDFVKVYVLQQFVYDATRRPTTMPHDQPSAVVSQGGQP